MIDLELRRLLNLREPAADGRPTHLSAASGLARIDDRLYVVADDELHLGVFTRGDDSPGELLRIVDGTLPAAPPSRKKHKPDFEALVRLPAFEGCPFGALLALGSGSKKRRHAGVLMRLDAGQRLAGPWRTIDLEPLHAALARRVDDLNIEGALVLGDRFVLLQRGNDGVADNACVHYALTDVLASLARSDDMDALAPRAILAVDLGRREGVTLGFTDGAALPDGTLLFSAVAERTDDSYLDGQCVGAVVGVLDRDGRVLRVDDVTPGYKIEGIAADRTAAGMQFLAVTDPDDATEPACLVAGLLRND
jgi:hypothetical protein